MQICNYVLAQYSMLREVHASSIQGVEIVSLPFVWTVKESCQDCAQRGGDAGESFELEMSYWWIDEGSMSGMLMNVKQLV